MFLNSLKAIFFFFKYPILDNLIKLGSFIYYGFINFIKNPSFVFITFLNIGFFMSIQIMFFYIVASKQLDTIIKLKIDIL